jgi:hypothetical protein
MDGDKAAAPERVLKRTGAEAGRVPPGSPGLKPSSTRA